MCSFVRTVGMVTTGLCAISLVMGSFDLSSTEDEYVQQTLTKCSTYVYDLIICLAEEKSFKFEIKKCDYLLAKTFICLSSGEEVSIAHVQQETEENEDQIIIKRGLGRCIHQCLKGQGKMNFIQCKSMCHK